MWVVLESKVALKKLAKSPKNVRQEYEAWKKVIELSGPSSVRMISGYKDHALKGQWQGARSSSLDYLWRVIYAVVENLIQVRVLEVTPHDYRKKN